MRTSALICLTLLVVGSFAMTAEEAEVVEKLNTISKSNFGKTVLDTIQIQMASGDPIEDLIELLKSLQLGVETDQKDDDNYILGVRAGCDSDAVRLSNEITAANDRAEELNNEINEKTPIRNEKVQLLGEKNDLAEHVGDRIVELDEDKAEHDADWAAEQQEHDRATYVIERAKEVIENGFGGSTSFLQKERGGNKTTTFAQVSAHFKTNAKSFKRNSWNHIFKLLSQITASTHIQADAGTISKILTLIDALLEKIAESREIERREYEAWVSEYQDARDAQVSLLNETEAQIGNLEAEISALNKRLENATAERDEQRERSRQKSIELVERTKWCDDESASYASRRSDRNEQINIISDCIGIIESKIRILRDFVKQRLG